MLEAEEGECIGQEALETVLGAVHHCLELARQNLKGTSNR